jgi:lysophospholipase L1-like esterase
MLPRLNICWTLIAGLACSLGIPETMSRGEQPGNVSTPTLAPTPLVAGDRVVLLGDGFIERMQHDGYLETRLTSRLPGTSVTFRNLGWSGDTVQGIARAVFGTPEEGFARLMKDVTEAEPTVIVVAYGGNEAHAGEAGWNDFQQQLRRLLDELVGSTGARLMLLVPRPYEKLPPPLPDTASYNRKLERYVGVLRDEAVRRGIPLIPAADRPGADHHRWTTDGIHLTEAGAWHVAARLADSLGYGDTPWQFDVDVRSGTYNAENVSLQSWQKSEHRHEWTLLDRYLPAPFPPDTAPPDPAELPYGHIQVRGLPPGTYQLLVEGVPAVTATAAQWEAGQPLPLRAGQGQVEELRRTIREKNELYFHRHRPQNETYLFLFRKHEQGNNAVEIPQFDPLISEKEEEIARLRLPRPGKYELVRIE